MLPRVFLDFAAGAPMPVPIIENYLQNLRECYGNASGIHREAQKAEATLHTARENIAGVLGVQAREIIFTSSGTESNNIAIRGAALFGQKHFGKNHLICSQVEHPSVLETIKDLVQNYNFTFSILPVDNYGVVSLSDLSQLFLKQTALVSVCLASSEIGTIQPILELAELCKKHEVLLHVDAVQGAPWLALQPHALNADLLSIGGQKLGVSGSAALYKSAKVTLAPILTGGLQEQQLRPGTQAVALAMALSQSLVWYQNNKSLLANMINMRDKIISHVLSNHSNVCLTGHPSQRLPNHASFAFQNLDGNTLTRYLDARGFAVSPGTACKTGNTQASIALVAIGLSSLYAHGGLRVSLGLETTEAHIDAFLEALTKTVPQARANFSFGDK